jgi:Cap4-like dsDNA endonuclease family protein
LSIAPDEILDAEDPGDDVALRFLYQHCYAAIHALKMILPQSAVAEVICENHEDFLVSFTDGTLVAVQIKTRDLTQPVFKAKDEQVIKALARFAKLEARFPRAFARFEFLTNHAFWHDQETENNLPYLLGTVQVRGTVKGLKQDHILRSWVAKIAAEAGLTESEVVAALLKCRCTAKNDTVASGQKDVLEAIAECPGLGGTPIHKAKALVGALVSLAREASTRSQGTSVLALYEAGSNFGAVLAHEKLQAKRITKAQVEAVVATAVSVTVETLCVDDTVPFDELPKKLAVMYQKLEKGELETARVLQLEDLVHSVEALYMKWATRFGAEEANKRINDLKKVVQFDCTEAKVAASKNGEPYASAMYGALYTQVKARCAMNDEHVYKCRPEHLMGTAGILSQECKVWWSKEFQLAKDEPCKT